MRFPWANTALLILLISQFITGYIGFTNGEVGRQWLLWLHGIGAYAITLLIFWKSAIILDSLKKTSRFDLARIAFILLALLLTVTLISGLVWTIAGERYLFGFSLLTIHIFIAAALGLLLLFHTIKYRWLVRHPKALNRRSFLNLTTVTIAGFFAWHFSERISRIMNLPGSQRRFTGSYETGSYTGSFPSVSWISDRPPMVDMATWRLLVNGEAERHITYSIKQIYQMNQIDLAAVLDCTGGWFTEQVWSGVSLEELIESAGPSANVRSLTVRSLTGYSRRFEIAEAANLMLAHSAAGKPLTPGNGFPLRLVAPGHRGLTWVKWISEITLNNTPAFLQSPLPLQ